jgi:perosamine synthetase
VSSVPVNQPLLAGNEEKYLIECAQSGWISSDGPFVKRFEQDLARRVNRQYGIAVTNGSAALDAAVAALKLNKGDEVIMPAFTIISCASSIIRAGAVPVLVDSTSDTWCMDTSQLEQKITPRTRAIMVVHTYGLPVDMDPILNIAKKHKLRIIEDAAEAHGLLYKNRPCGSFGDISIFSFYANKHVTTGEGGMLVTDNADLAERCSLLRNLFFRNEQRFVHEELGWNLRMSNLQAAVGVAQLEELDNFILRKKQMGNKYNELLSNVPGIQLPCKSTAYAENNYWVYGIVLEDNVPFDAKEAMNQLQKHNIGTRPFFWPMHEQPVFRKMGLFNEDCHPVASRIARRGFYIPSGLALTDSQIEQSAEAVKKVLA